MKQYRIGVIGAGAIAQGCHIPGYMAAKNCILAAVADPEKKCLKMLHDNKMIFQKEYSDYREMLKEEKLDFVSICVPNKFHAECAIAAMRAGADILLEKPITLTLKEGKAVQRTAEKEKRRIMVGFSHRFNELNVAAKKALEAGKIGKPYMIRIRFAHSGPFPGWAKTDWFYNPEIAGGGALLDMAVHAFDISQWFLGPITGISAKAKTLRKKIKVDDNVVALMEFGDSCMGYVECGWTSPAGFGGIEIMGDKGLIVCDYNNNRTLLTCGCTKPDGTHENVTSILHKGKKWAWNHEMAYAVKTLASGKPFSPGIEDGIKTLKVVLAAYKSSATGRFISLK